MVDTDKISLANHQRRVWSFNCNSNEIKFLFLIVSLTFVIGSDGPSQNKIEEEAVESESEKNVIPFSFKDPENPDVDNEVEIEIEGAGGTSEFLLGETSAEDDGITGSGNQNESDPTAVAKIYDDEHVPDFVAKESENDKGAKTTVNPGKQTRVKVVCWDFRSMPLPEESLVEEGNTTNSNVTFSTNNATMHGLLEDLSSGEETENIEAEVDANDDIGDVKTVKEFNNISESQGESNETIVDSFNRTVELVNMTILLHEVLYSNPSLKTRSTPSNCSIVMFYTSWCPFSAKAAPHFNALPRAYPPMRVAAIDSSKYKNVNTYFGILSVPTVVLFHNGKIIAKFNDTSFTLNKFADFIEYFTDLKHEERINVTTKDFEGPLSSVPIKEIDWYLYLAWIFIIVCFVHFVSKSAIWRRAVDYVRTAWREAEAQHEHID